MEIILKSCKKKDMLIQKLTSSDITRRIKYIQFYETLGYDIEIVNFTVPNNFETPDFAIESDTFDAEVSITTASGPKGLMKMISWGSSVRAATKAMAMARPVNRPK